MRHHRAKEKAKETEKQKAKEIENYWAENSFLTL